MAIPEFKLKSVMSNSVDKKGNENQKISVEQDQDIAQNKVILKFQNFHKLLDHKGAVNGLAVLDNQHFVSVGTDASIRVWSLAERACIGVIEKTWVKALKFYCCCSWSVNYHTANIHYLSLSNNGHHMVTGGADQRICIWDLKTNQSKSITMPRTVRSVDMSPDGEWIIVAGLDVKILSAKTGKCLKAFGLPKDRDGYGSMVTSAFVSRSTSGNFDIGTAHGNSIVWKLEINKKLTTTLVQNIKTHDCIISAVAICPSDEWLISAGDDGKITMTSLKHPNDNPSVLQGHQSVVTGLSVNRTFIASGSWDKTVRIWDIKTKTCLSVLPYNSEVYALKIREEAEIFKMFAGFKNGTLVVGEIQTRQVSAEASVTTAASAASETAVVAVSTAMNTPNTANHFLPQFTQLQG
jgi:WD40 repeat protein